MNQTHLLAVLGPESVKEAAPKKELGYGWKHDTGSGIESKVPSFS
jgi:hypothetical protein